jgi:acyl-CoA thioesterase FadM
MRDHPDDSETSNHWRAPAPNGAYTQAMRVRSYEVGRSGSIGIGTILRYFESLATEASAFLGFDHRWYERNGSAWVVRDFDLLLGPLPGIGADLTLATWVADAGRVQARREYLARRRDTGHIVARASARWAYVDRVRGHPTRLQDDLAASIPLFGHPMPITPLSIPSDTAPTATDDLALAAREYEADTQRHINNCVYADWLAEGSYRTFATRTLVADAWAAAALERIERPHAERDDSPPGFRPRSYHIEYVRPALPGAAIRVHTDLYRAGTRAALAAQTITGAAESAIYVRAISVHLSSPCRSDPAAEAHLGT